MKSRFEHIDASATWRLEWCTTVCSLLMIAILLFNLLFRAMSSFRGVRLSLATTKRCRHLTQVVQGHSMSVRRFIPFR